MRSIWRASVSIEIGFHQQKDLVVFFLSLISEQQSLTANSCIQTEGFSDFYFPSITCTVFLYVTRMIMYHIFTHFLVAQIHIFTHFLAAQICSRFVLCFEKCQARRGLLVLLAHFGFATSCSLLGFSLSCVCIGDCVESGASFLFPDPTQSHKLET